MNLCNFVQTVQKERVLIVFYENFLNLCNKKGVAPSAAVVEMGFQKSVVTRWKKSIPTDANKQKIAQYFGVTVDELMQGESNSQKEKPLVNGDEELTEYLEELRTRPEMKMLFQLTKGATKEDVEKAVKVIEAMLGK